MDILNRYEFLRVNLKKINFDCDETIKEKY